MRISSRDDISWLKVSRSITKQLTPSGSSAMMFAVLRSSLWSNFRIRKIAPALHYFIIAIEERKVPLESFLAEEITLVQCPNELLVRGVGLLDGHFHLTSTNDEERIAPRALTHDVVTIVVKSLRASEKRTEIGLYKPASLDFA